MARPAIRTRAICARWRSIRASDPRMNSRYAHVVDMAKKNPALFIAVKVE
jgi:hypothetical protein